MSQQVADDKRSVAVDVSVIMPACNAAGYLTQSLGSVLAQTLTNLQLVIVDDGSVDDTPDIARSVRDDRVVVLSGPNRGPSHARNAGIAAARPSPYVAFIDADDAWDEAKLARQAGFLESHPEVLGVGCLMQYISSRGRPLGTTGQVVTVDDRARMARGELLPFHMSSLMVRSAALAQAGGFDEFVGTQGSEDLELYARLARLGPLQCLPVVLGSVRIHAESAMARRRREINRAARFVRRRLAARDAGRDLTWDEFLVGCPPTWRERRQDLVERLYRAAALSYADERHLRAAGCGVLSAIVDPMYTVRRVYRQRLAPFVRATMRGSAAADRTVP